MIVVSHRGPYSFSTDADGGFTARQGAGGMVSALRPLLESRRGDTWIAAAISEGDRAARRAGAAATAGIALRLLELDPYVHRLHYDVVSNSIFWFLFHDLFDLPRRPRLDHRFSEAWAGYVDVNAAFADAVVDAAEPGAIVLVQDFHLMLVPGRLRATRPDLHVVHFTHTPFAGPDAIRVLPAPVADAVCASMATVPTGFHTARWRDAYIASTRQVLGADARITPPFVSSFGPDLEALAATVAAPATRDAASQLQEQVGDRRVIFRTDRVEPSKNIARGFLAYDRLLEVHPEWRERVVFVAFVYPSREGLAEYLAYRQEIEQTAARVNERWGTTGWAPVLLDTRDDFSRSVAGLMRADVLMVNPMKDGLNLVAKEGPLLNRRDAVLCLSREAGAFDELGEASLGVNPFDIEEQAVALDAALRMDPDERAKRAARLRELATVSSPSSWLAAQVERAEST